MICLLRAALHTYGAMSRVVHSWSTAWEHISTGGWTPLIAFGADAAEESLSEKGYDHKVIKDVMRKKWQSQSTDVGLVPVRPMSNAEQLYEHRSVQSKLQQQRGQAMLQEKLRRRKRR